MCSAVWGGVCTCVICARMRARACERARAILVRAPSHRACAPHSRAGLTVSRHGAPPVLHCAVRATCRRRRVGMRYSRSGSATAPRRRRWSAASRLRCATGCSRTRACSSTRRCCASACGAWYARTLSRAISAAPADRYPRGRAHRQGVFGAGGRAGGPKAAGAGQNAKRRPIRLGFADPRLRETASAALCHVRIPTARPFPRRQRCASAHARRLGSSLPHLHREAARPLPPARASAGPSNPGCDRRRRSFRVGSFWVRPIDRSTHSLTGRRRTHRRMANSSC